MPTRDSYRYIYVAAMHDCVKIGITYDPDQRERTLRRNGTGARMVRVWKHEYPYAVELMCRDAWHLRRKHCVETFEATPRAAVMLVNRMIKAHAGGDRPGNRRQRVASNKKRRDVRDKINGWLAEGLSVPEIVRRFKAERFKIAESTIRKYWRAEEIAAARSKKRKPR